MNFNTLQNTFKNLPAAQGLLEISRLYAKKVVFSSSLGQEDQVITKLIAEANLNIDIFTLDTGRLFPEHYSLLEDTIRKYKKPIKVYFPNQEDVSTYANSKGINAFFKSVENRKECCFIRKVKPLQKALKGYKVWVTGLRAEQSENRQDLQNIELDEANNIIKYHPLLHWTMDEMQSFIDLKNIPCNPLHKQGFVSIGCAPCTRAIFPGENPRAGRWYWEQSAKECGLHTTYFDTKK